LSSSRKSFPRWFKYQRKLAPSSCLSIFRDSQIAAIAKRMAELEKHTCLLAVTEARRHLEKAFRTFRQVGLRLALSAPDRWHPQGYPCAARFHVLSPLRTKRDHTAGPGDQAISVSMGIGPTKILTKVANRCQELLRVSANLIKLGVACRYQLVSVTWARTRYVLSAMTWRAAARFREITISRSTANATSSSAASSYYTTNLES
jgi:hypothetical protein